MSGKTQLSPWSYFGPTFREKLFIVPIYSKNYQNRMITINEKCPKTKDRIHIWIVESIFFDKCKACDQKRREYFEY